MKLTEVLDEYYKNYDFMFLENANFDYVRGQLDVYVKGQNWLIVFQQMGVSKAGPETWIYYYSNIADEQFGFADYENIILKKDPSDALFKGTVTINDTTYNYSLNEKDYSSHTIKILDESYLDTYVLRVLHEINPDEITWHIPSDQLVAIINQPNDWIPFYSTDHWEHTEVESAPPSQCVFFLSLERAIIEKDRSLIEKKIKNTHWENWTDYDFDKQADWEIDFEDIE